MKGHFQHMHSFLSAREAADDWNSSVEFPNFL